MKSPIADAMMKSLDSSQFLSTFASDQAIAFKSASVSASAMSSQLDAILRGPSFAAFQLELDRAQEFVARYASRTFDETDEEEGRVTLAQTLRSGFAIVFNTEFKFATPQQRVALLLAVIYFVINQASCIYQSHLAATEAKEHRRIERAQAETIAKLTETVHQLQATLEAPSPAPSILVTVTRRSFLREGPAGTTKRVGTMRSGQRLKVISLYAQWDYVEVLRNDGVLRWPSRMDPPEPRVCSQR